jgi:hypothetical protein
MCLDDAQKKFILGDTQGNLKIFNYLNGALLKSMKGTTSREITNIEYVLLTEHQPAQSVALRSIT